MQNWRHLGWAGSILGLGVTSIDQWLSPIPYELIIPAEIAALVLIFTGLIRRKQGQEMKQSAALR